MEKLQDVDRPTDKLETTIKNNVPFKIGQRSKGSSLEKTGLQDVAHLLAGSGRERVMALKDKPRMAYLVSKPALQRNDAEQKALFDGYLHHYDASYVAVAKVLSGVQQEERAIKKRGTVAHVMSEKDQEPAAFCSLPR